MRSRLSAVEKETYTRRRPATAANSLTRVEHDTSHRSGYADMLIRKFMSSVQVFNSAMSSFTTHEQERTIALQPRTTYADPCRVQPLVMVENERYE